MARECGVSTFPALIYFRRNNPVFYDGIIFKHSIKIITFLGDFKDSEVVLRWLRSHDEATIFIKLHFFF